MLFELERKSRLSLVGIWKWEWATGVAWRDEVVTNWRERWRNDVHDRVSEAGSDEHGISITAQPLPSVTSLLRHGVAVTTGTADLPQR